ncbi:MAG: DNA polymerase III subunit delta [Acidobacteria bacterium]|nr:DNA polymerase III subunit delta [Acidobacteriota bacterium]
MKSLTPDAFLQAIARGQIDPLYLFTGPLPQGRKHYASDVLEEHLQRQAVRALIHHAVDPATSDFNLSIFSAADVPLAQIVDAAQQLPVLSQRCLVLVYDLDKAFKTVSNSESSGSKPVAESPGIEELIEYLKRPSETTTVVFFYSKPDRRLNLTTALLKACIVVQFSPLNEAEAKAWAKKYLRRHDCIADDAALGLLIGRVGTDLTHLVNELDKLITYVRRGPIARAQIEALVPRLKEHTNFELSDHILERDCAGALKLLRRQLCDGQEPVMLLGAIARLYRQMALAKDLMAQGAPSSEVAKAIGMSPYSAGEFNKQVRHISMEEILHGIQRIAAVDRAIKNSLGPPALQLEILVYELCGPQVSSG